MPTVNISKNKFTSPVKINKNNWPKEYPYAPKVTVSLTHDGDNMTLLFKVNEKYTKAEITKTNGRVWTDSCVEFFIAFDEKGYYNFETTCAGVQLLGYNVNHGMVTHANEELINSIQKSGTLVGKNFSEKEGENKWELKIIIPKEAFFQHKIETFNGLKARGNFYKCGDELSHPHFLSWTTIKFEKPNFHLPEFFGDLIFE